MFGGTLRQKIDLGSHKKQEIAMQDHTVKTDKKKIKYVALFQSPNLQNTNKMIWRQEIQLLGRGDVFSISYIFWIDLEILYKTN